METPHDDQDHLVYFVTVLGIGIMALTSTSSYSMVMLCESRLKAIGNTVCKFTAAFGHKHKKRKKRRSLKGIIARAKKKRWWDEFFFQEEGDWFGWKDDYDFIAEDVIEENEASDDKEKFEAWKRRAEAITELREAQQDMANQESRHCEDWLLMPLDNNNGDNAGFISQPPSPPPAGDDNNSLIPSPLSNLLAQDDDDLLYEDRVFRYASLNSAAFLALLVIIPLALDFLVHDYALMPFLDRYVKTVPLAAQMLDVRREQKLEIVEQLNLEKARLRLEVAIGKAPPLSDDQIWLELRHKALDLREELRLENRRAFANIWSDMVFGFSLFILLYCNQNKVALLKFTGYKIVGNISDTGKAFLIILITDIFLGYHSESGWQTLIEVLVDHYGLQIDQVAITIFVCLVPVIIDACVKLWMFKFLPRLSPKVSNIFQEMKRH